MFDVALAGGESLPRIERLSGRATGRCVAEAAGLRLGMTVCYDLRFPRLYRDLAQAGAEVLTVPSAFTVPTGEAHWHVLLRARAIETGAYVLAPAQSGVHAAATGPQRRTYGHSLAVSPWGEVLADAGEAVGVTFVEIDPAEVARARGMVPSLGTRPGLCAAGRTMNDRSQRDPAVIALFSEIVMVETLAKNRLTRVLPSGMELSHFMVLNHFARLGGEKTPAQLARVFHVTKGAMTNTIGRLEASGYVHVRPDWEDGRRKRVSISPAGLAARDRAVEAIAPVFDDVVAGLGLERMRATLPTLRKLRELLDPD